MGPTRDGAGGLTTAFPRRRGTPGPQDAHLGLRGCAGGLDRVAKLLQPFGRRQTGIRLRAAMGVVFEHDQGRSGLGETGIGQEGPLGALDVQLQPGNAL